MILTKILSLFLCFCLILEQSVFAQTIDLSHYFARNSGQTIPQSDKFRPLHLRYISYDNQANDFKILLDKGDFFNQKTKNEKTSESLNFQTPELENTTQELMKYFFIGLALPNEKFWVNLRPDSPDNILDPDLEKTDIGRIFLEADLQLKKDTSGMTSPQTKEGREYWEKLYKKAGELFGTENITIPTITRPWIVPDEVIIRESPEGAYIYKATLKVMLEEDYLRETKEEGRGTTINYSFSDPRLKELNEYSTQLIKESIIPRLTKEINSARRYAPLRQVYYSLILAQWFKQKYGNLGSPRASGTRAPVNNYLDLIDSGNLANITSSRTYDKQVYFQQYQQSFKDGEYNLQEPVYTPMGQSIRRYMSGGIKWLASSSAVKIPGKSEVPQSDYSASFVYGGQLAKVSSAVDNGAFGLQQYYRLTEEGKNHLREEFKEVFGGLLSERNNKYFMLDEYMMESLVYAAKEFLKRFWKKNSRYYCLGRSPLWIMETARLISSKDKDAFQFTPIYFSGRWYELIKNGESIEYKMNYEGPSALQIAEYRKYLESIGLTPKDIVNKAKQGEKTTIVEYVQSGESLESFLSILEKWAEEYGLKDKLRGSLYLILIPTLYKEHGEFRRRYHCDRLLGYDNLMVRIANREYFNDGRGVHYNFDKWLYPPEKEYSKRLRLAEFMLIDFLHQNKFMDLPSTSSAAENGYKKNNENISYTVAEIIEMLSPYFKKGDSFFKNMEEMEYYPPLIRSRVEAMGERIYLNKISLHLANGPSLLPFVDMLLGCRVVASDGTLVNMSRLGRVLHALLSKVPSAAFENFEKKRIEVKDINDPDYFKKGHNNKSGYDDNSVDHITVTNLLSDPGTPIWTLDESMRLLKDIFSVLRVGGTLTASEDMLYPLKIFLEKYPGYILNQPAFIGIGSEFMRFYVFHLEGKPVFSGSPLISLTGKDIGSDKGGIDLSRINKSIRTESVSLPGAGGGSSPVDVDFDLNEELSQLQKLLNAQIIPSSSRLERYARAARASPLSSPDSADSAISLVAETFRLQEEKAVSAPAELKALAAWMEQAGGI